MSIFNIYDESDESRPGGLYRAAKYTFKLDNEGNLVKGVLSYDRGFQVFTDDKGNRTIIKSGPSKQAYYVDPKQIQRFINTWNRKIITYRMLMMCMYNKTRRKSKMEFQKYIEDIDCLIPHRKS